MFMYRGVDVFELEFLIFFINLLLFFIVGRVLLIRKFRFEREGSRFTSYSIELVKWD